MYRHPVVPSRPRRLALALYIACAATPAAADDGLDCLIEPSRVIEVRAAVEGLITGVRAERGDVVRAGQVLVELDAGLERAGVESARFRATMQGAIRSGEARVAFARTKSRRHDQLAAARYVSVQERDEAATESRLAETELDDARDNQRLAELELRRLEEQLRLRTVLSPIDALVVERYMHPGELADNRDLRKPILKLADIATLHVEVLAPLAQWNRIRVGQPVEVLPEAPIGGRHAARVVAVDRVMDAASATFGVRLELPNPDLALPAGIRCRALFDAGEPPPAPPAADAAPALVSVQALRPAPVAR